MRGPHSILSIVEEKANFQYTENGDKEWADKVSLLQKAK